MKRMGVLQGYVIVAGLFETCEKTMSQPPPPPPPHPPTPKMRVVVDIIFYKIYRIFDIWLSIFVWKFIIYFF